MDEDAGERGPRPGLVRLGAIAGIPVYVRASWFLVAGVIAVLMAPRIEAVSPGLGNLVYVAGLAFAVLLYLSILLHEASHALAARAYGMRVRSVVLHFLGGFTELDEEATTAGREAVVAVVGPLTSLAVGALAWVVAPAAPDGLAEFALRALAGANLVIGVVNLLPGLPLDGGRVLRAAVWGATGRPLTGSLVAGWAGRGLAVITLAYPFVVAGVLDTEPVTTDVIFAALLAAFLWVGASQAISAARHRDRFSTLDARRLARRALAVAYDTPLGEAVRQAQEEQAGGLVVVTTDGRPVGVVNEQAVLSTPADRRPWVRTGTLARTVEPGLLLAADLEGEALFRAMKQTPASEYVLVEPDGSVHGLLVTNDVAEAFNDS